MTNTEGSAGSARTTDSPAADQYSWGNGLSAGTERPAAGSDSTFVPEPLAADQYPGGQQPAFTDPAGFSTPPPVSQWTPTAPPSTPPTWAQPPTASAPADEPSTADVAKDQAASVAGGAADAAKNVAGVAKEQVAQVATEARQQVSQLLGQARSELTGQAQVQQEKVASGLHSVGDQLRAMAQGSSEPGAVTDITHQAADKAHEIAAWFENRDPGSVLDEVRAFARQRPMAFLGLSLGAGILVGRLARGLAADPDEGGSSSATRTSELSSGRPVRPVLDPSPFPAAAPVGDPTRGDDWSSSWSDGR